MNTLFYKQNKKDPFAETPLPQSYYHPTLQKTLTKKSKETRIQPEDNQTKGSQKLKPKISENTSQKQKKFLDKGHEFISRELPTHDTPSPGNNSSKFNESWPSSERPSAIDSPNNRPNVFENFQPTAVASNLPVLSSKDHLAFEQSTLKLTADDKQSRINQGKESMKSDQYLKLSEMENKKPAGSTIAKYIDRFRYGEPSSREDRQLNKNSSKNGDFWWLQSDSPSFQTSTPTDTESGRQRLARPSDSPVKGTTTSKKSSTSYLSGATYESDTSSFLAPGSVDRQTSDIQRRANDLIERSESSFSNESIVSFQPSNLFTIQPAHQSVPGHVPASDFSSKIHVPIRSNIQSNVKGLTRKKTPEDDILYQWRLRRKLEQAREKSVKFAESLHQYPSHQDNAARNQQDVDSKLSEFRERLRQQEQISALGIQRPTADQKIHRPTVDRSSYVSQQVKHTGNDPMPQTIATQTNENMYGRADLKDVQDDREPGPGRNRNLNDNTINSLPDRIARLDHHNLPTKSGVQPHLHMSCDIIPCHDVELHKHARDKENKVDGDKLPRQDLDVGEHKTTSDHVNMRNETFESNYVDRGKRGKKLPFESNTKRELQNEASHRSDTDNSLEKDDSHSDENENKLPIETNRRVEKHEPHRKSFQRRDFKISQPQFEDVETSLVETSKDVISSSTDAAQASKIPLPFSPISSTIGKVVSDRLFSTPQPSTSPGSSPPRMSIPSSNEGDYLQQSVSPYSSVNTPLSIRSSAADPKDPANEDKDDESVFEDLSSGEFSDDELLQVLRQKREAFEAELREIDQLLAKIQN